MGDANEGIVLARQLPWLWSARHLFRKVTVVAAGVALCAGLAATGTAATVTGATSVTGAASSAQADTFYPAYPAYPAAGNAAGPALLSLARQAAAIRPLHRASLLVEVRLRAERAAATKAAASRAARARAAAARVRLERAAAARAEARGEIAQRVLPTGLRREAVRQAVTVESETPTGSPQEIASEMLAQRGWTGQFSCLDSLWRHESGWNIHAENPSTGAYGIPQALPGSRMASAGPYWQSSAATQISWGLNYISNRYGSPCGAWDHEEATGWY